MNSHAGLLSEVLGYHDPLCEVSTPVLVISDDFYIELSIALMDIVGTIGKLKPTAFE